MKKRVLAVLLSCAMTVGMTGCAGKGTEDTDSTASGSDDGKVTFSIFNSKKELQECFEDAAEAYGKENNVNIEVYYTNDTVAAHLATRYASGQPYTLNMIDAKDAYSLGAEYGFDMGDQKWVNDTDYAISVDGKTVGFPVCIEARGLLYNADAIEKITGEKFDPESVKTLNDLKEMCDTLVKGGMESPTAILKPDWSLAAHYLQQVYEERDDVDGFIEKLYNGEADLINDPKFNMLMDTFDVLKEYNIFKAGPVSAEDEQVHQAMAEGQDAFQFGGCWEWNDIIDFDYTGNVGLMPVPQNGDDDYTGKIVGGGSKYFYIDNSEYTTDAQREAAEAFLDWIVYTDEGQGFISDTCAMISPFKNNEVPCANELGVYVKKYVDEGKIIPNYDYDPDDHYSVLGASMQKYLADQIDREGLAHEIEEYWANVKQ